MQVQGTVVALLLAAGWIVSGIMRLKELRRLQQPQPSARCSYPDRAAAGYNHNASPLSQMEYKTPVDSLHRSHAAQKSQQPGKCSTALSDASLNVCGTSAHASVTSGRCKHSLRQQHAVSPLAQASKCCGKASDLGECWPSVTVVLPVKGTRSHTGEAWLSHLNLDYGGPLELLFVVDDVSDAAYGPLSEVIAAATGVNAKLLIAPHATCSSQKIRNILTGLAAASSAASFLVFLDDDVILSPDALQPLVAPLMDDHSLFMATGYPMDVAEAGAGLLTYCIMAYHLPLLIALSVRQRSSFVWGGCMVFRAEALRCDSLGIVQAWADGGYSDDLIVAAKCRQASLTVICPPSAIFRQMLPANPTWSEFWNYLRRQLYVMDTWASPHNRRLNRGMLLLHSWLSWTLVAPLSAGAPRQHIFVFEVDSGTIISRRDRILCGMAAVILRAAVWAGLLLLLPTQQCGSSTSWDWVSRFTGQAAQAALQTGCHSSLYLGAALPTDLTAAPSIDPGSDTMRLPPGFDSTATVSAAAFLVAVAAAGVSLRWMTGVVMRLLEVQNPSDKSLPGMGAYSWPLVGAGFFLTNALVPVCALYTVLCPSITWSGTTYWKSKGKTVKVRRN